MARRETSAFKLPPAVEQSAQEALKRLLDERFELQVGRFEAQEILELVLAELAPAIYNQAIGDVQAHLKDRFESIESDLWALEKS